ncbi:MAG: AEC family transporter [Gammaproteobacteria bacterium]|nr:AEC family transporter [Gammaproteobacteria bacterium]
MNVIEITLPVFAVIAIGFVAIRARLIDAAANRGLHRFVFYVALPCLLFGKMTAVTLSGHTPWSFLSAYYLGTFTAFGLGAWLVRVAFGRALAEQGTAGLSASYSNTVLIGIPLVLQAYGDEAALPLFAMLAFHSLLLFPVAVTVIELGRGHPGQARHAPLKALRELLRTPLILAMAAGLGMNAAGMTVPAAIGAGIELVGAAAPACALFCLGASLAAYNLRGDLREPLAIVTVKNFLHPLLVGVLVTRVFGIDPLWAGVAVTIAALPTGVNVYVIAHQYGVSESTTARTVLLSTLTSVLTVPPLLSVLVAR